MKKFNPLVFLASLGAGGISVIPFALLNYSFPHEKGLIYIGQVDHGSLSIMQELLIRFLEGTMIVFVSIHFVLTIIFFVQLWKWLKEKEFTDMLHDPLSNSSMLAPFISVVMTLNVFIGPIRYFISSMAENLQVFMMPAFIVWALIWVALMAFEIKLLTISFEKSFDVNKIHFGWLLHPFALAMLSVTGAGIAALAQNAEIAHVSAFLTVVSASMGFFLLVVKLIALFKSHFALPGLPERQFLPSFLIVIPNITLYAITAFRLGHYIEHHHSMEMGPYFLIVILSAFAFETWYMAFGLSLLKNYFKNHFSKEFYLSQWGLVCPFVAYAVLGSFLYSVFVLSILLYAVILASMLTSIVFFFILSVKHLKVK
ncbi:hypothetical protein C0416_04655 [bacterium]|nr:hypothetical protein [bacterium]